MHNAALAAVGLRHWRYQLLPAPAELLGEIVAALPGAGFRGVNVTIPHKRAALALADRASERARAIGAANTLVFDSAGAIVADNTDAPALIEALPSLVGRTVVVLGAGGSARAAVWALRAAGAAATTVWNRTPARARALCDELGGTVATTLPSADVLVNCTSVGLGGTDPFERLPLAPDDLSRYGVVVDFVYAASGTALVASARGRGVATVDGHELLVGQGALSFTQFTGAAAPVEVMRAAVG
ncbi:MAG: shikimate dehydrogenase [Solirubrobacterales bacterium]|nr:shikimate dehydrogenase [Solirubrobacterales bacterium]